jgi:hypothetical protein
MKFIVVGIAGSMLLCAVAAAGGIYIGKLTKPFALTTVEKANTDQAYFIRNLIALRADVSDVLSGKDAFRNLRQIARGFRLASGRYLLTLKNLPESSLHTIESNCLTDADEALEQMKLAAMSVHSCEHAYFRTSRFCSAKEKSDASDYLSRKTNEVSEALNRCLDTLLDAPATTAAVSK